MSVAKPGWSTEVKVIVFLVGGFFVVVLGGGILAAIAIPKFANTIERAYTAQMKADLRNLVTAQEAYFTANKSTYAATIPAMAAVYRPSQGVTVELGAVSNTGWTATATHESTVKTCTITIGGTASNQGMPICQ